MIDSHAHLDFKDFEGQEEEVVARAREAGVLKIINVGVDIERSKKSIALAKRFEGTVFATVGLHPQDAVGDDSLQSTDYGLQGLHALAKDASVIAIGECGLDFFRVETEEEKERQKKVFEEQIKLSIEIDLPLVVHTREAEAETLTLLEKYKDKTRGVVHCFTGSINFARKLIDMGFYIGFTGIITFGKSEELQEVVRELPLEKILVETDAPFLAPTPYRGKANEPAFVVEVAKKIAEIKGVSLEEVEKVTTKNTEKLFVFEI